VITASFDLDQLRQARDSWFVFFATAGRSYTAHWEVSAGAEGCTLRLLPAQRWQRALQ